jgi:flavodoxin short chain
MAKVFIVYGSTSGNTESVAEKLKGIVQNGGHEVTLKNVTEVSVSDLADYDVLLPGSSTWNEGELQDDFVEYHMQLESEKPDLNGKKFAVFGCGETVYEFFCKAVDTLEETFSKLGAAKLTAGLKIDGYPEDDENIKLVEEWGQKVVEALK